MARVSAVNSQRGTRRPGSVGSAYYLSSIGVLTLPEALAVETDRTTSGLRDTSFSLTNYVHNPSISQGGRDFLRLAPREKLSIAMVSRSSVAPAPPLIVDRRSRL